MLQKNQFLCTEGNNLPQPVVVRQVCYEKIFFLLSKDLPLKSHHGINTVYTFSNLTVVNVISRMSLDQSSDFVPYTSRILFMSSMIHNLESPGKIFKNTFKKTDLY